jgi:hypothetical protein
MAGPGARDYGGRTMQPIEFTGFAGDCLIAGKMTMFGERLTDFLNGQERFRVHHCEFESLADGHKVALDSISLEREELLAVVASGPRGAEKQRVSVQANRLQVSIGPYMILGRLHSTPGSDVMASVLKRDPMIPLTNATIAYELNGEIVARDFGTIIVNRLQVDWISPTTDAATIFPDTQIRSPYSHNLIKDFTGVPTD